MGVAGRGQNKDFVSQGLSFWKPPAASTQPGPSFWEMKPEAWVPPPHSIEQMFYPVRDSAGGVYHVK